MRYLVLNIFLFLNVFCYSQRVSVKSYIDSNNVKIGSQVILSLEVEKPGTADVRFPVLADTITKQIEILKKFPIDTLSNKDNILRIRQKYVLTSFDSGTFLIPSFAFLLKRDSLADSITEWTIYVTPRIVIGLIVRSLVNYFRNVWKKNE